jgi:hypothetical protein
MTKRIMQGLANQCGTFALGRTRASLLDGRNEAVIRVQFAANPEYDKYIIESAINGYADGLAANEIDVAFEVHVGKTSREAPNQTVNPSRAAAVRGLKEP